MRGGKVSGVRVRPRRHYLAELAAANGAEVTAVSASAERGSRLAALGAAEVVQDVAATDGPFDLVLESVGGKTFGAVLTVT
jgi:NADPH:quinone reductase-like Zn-dependent oxidoreductase